MAHLERVAVGDQLLMIKQLDQKLGGMATAVTGKSGTVAIQFTNTETRPIFDL
jgi:hypothetical protein